MLHSSATRVRSRYACSGVTRTVQAGAEDTDINVIVRRFGVTGQLPQSVRTPLAGDFLSVGSFQEAMNAIRSAQESFAKMPAVVRKRFDNDPRQFVDFVTAVDKDGALVNVEEMRKFGLAVPKEPEPVPAVTPVPPSPPAA